MLFLIKIYKGTNVHDGSVVYFDIVGMANKGRFQLNGESSWHYIAVLVGALTENTDEIMLSMISGGSGSMSSFELISAHLVSRHFFISSS